MPEWKGKSRGGSFGYKFFIFLIKNFGLKTAYLFIKPVVLYFVLSSPRATKSDWFYWRKIHKKNRCRAIRMIFIHYNRFGQVIVDKIAALSGFEKKFKYEFFDYDQFLKTLNDNTGVIIIGAHFGNWEIGGQFFGEYAKKMHLVMYDDEYQKIKNKLRAVMGENTYRVIRVNEENWSYMFAIKEALDKNEYVCFQGDRFIHEKNTLNTLFCGKEACFPSGVFQVASRFKAPVVFYFSEKESDYKYSFRFYFAAPVKRTNETKPEKALLAQYVRVLEQRIAEHPEQWFNFYSFWEAEKKQR